jgi:hypothetical protein
VIGADENKPEGNEGRTTQAFRAAVSGKSPSVSSGPHYLDMEEARELLAEMNIHLTPRQIKRSSDLDAAGKRKLPWFVDPIEGRLRIERNALLKAYLRRQVEAERNCEN